MSTHKKFRKCKSIADLSDSARKGKSFGDWLNDRADQEERSYIKSLKNPSDILAYRDKREEEVFIDNI